MKSARSRQPRLRTSLPQGGRVQAARGFHAALVALVFCSGFAALVYELLWFRKLGLVFGNTVQAAATVLAAFMVGLAWGAGCARRWLIHARNPVRLFGFIEAGIGLYALCVPAAFALAGGAYQLAARHAPDSAGVLTGIRFFFALGVLLIPTVLMGASLPVLAEAALRSRDRFAARLGLLYGSNTAGAMLGVIVCGFVLVPDWGVKLSNLFAAALNLVVGCVAIVLARRQVDLEIEAVSGDVASQATRSGRRRGLLAVAAVCGLLALAFETVWFRALVLVFGSTSYSFAIMVACFLLGLALGSATLGRLADRPGRAAWALAVAAAGIGLWTFISLHIYRTAPEMFLRLLAWLEFTWTGLVLTRAALAAVFLVPLAVLSGLAFTAVVRLIRDDSTSAGRAVASAFGVNALGSAAGAAGAGFFLLPWLGLERSLVVLGGVAVLLALLLPWCLRVAPRQALGFGIVVAALAVGIRLNSSPWDPLILSSGPYFAARENMAGSQPRLRERLELVELVFYREGATATVDVKRSADGRLYYSSDGKVEADTSPESMVLQRMMGHLPMLVHPHPRQVLNIGLGAGVTAGALTCHPGVHLEVAEIEPAAQEIARLWSARNHDLMQRGAFRLIHNDGRNHLLMTTNRYDVITSDPFEPVVAGAASLYTVDHFQLARSRLAFGGIMAQFLPLYELSRDDVLMILRSFLRVFPRSALFFTGTDTILLGLTDGAEIRMDVVASKFAVPGVRASLGEIGVTRPERLLDMLVMDILPGSSIVPDGTVNTDDRPFIEFSAPKSALDFRPDVNQQVLLERFEGIPAHYLAGLTPEAVAEVQRGHAALHTLLRASLRRSRGDLSGGIALLREAHRQSPESPIIRNELAKSLVLAAGKSGSAETVVALCREALTVDPTDFWAAYKLALHAVTTEQWTDAAENLRQGLTIYPDAALLLSLRAQMLAAQGDLTAACRDYEVVVRKLPRSAVFWDAYADCLERLGYAAESVSAHTRSRQLRGQ